MDPINIKQSTVSSISKRKNTSRNASTEILCVCLYVCAYVCVHVCVCACVRARVADALCTGCNWLRGADRHCSLACYQTDGKPERTAVSLWETQQTREAGNNTNRRERHLWTHTHMRAQTHGTAVTLTGCDSEESVSNVLLLDSLKDDGQVDKPR